LTNVVVNHPNGTIMGPQTREREKFVHEAMYRSHEMRISEQLLSRRRIPEPLLDFPPGHVGVGENTNPASRFCPLAREDGQLRHE
jgi:hypothetical protein